MIYSIATVCLSGTLRQKIEAIAAAGFRGIEIFENDLIAHDGPVSEIRQLIEDHNLEIVTYQPFRDFEGLAEPMRSRAFDRAEHKFDLMEQLDTDLLMVCSSCSPHALGGIQRAADDFHELGDRAEKRGFRVCYEALAWGRHVHDYRDSWEIVRRAEHERVGLCLDTFHIYSRHTDIGAMLNIPGDKIFLVQVADAPQLSMDHLSWSRHYRCFPGQGELPLSPFMDNLRTTGYDGPFSLEIFNDQFRSGSPNKTALDGYRSLVYMNNSQETINTEPVARLPETVPPVDVQFIEFAIDKSDQSDFETLIKKIGFAHIATHKKKSVELWRQGNINFLMNFDADSFAQRYYKEHGISVCALGLLCEQVDDMVERAAQLCYPPVIANPDSDTHGIPAITGPGKTLLYLVDKHTHPEHWDREFDHHSETSANAWLIRVDHVATSMNYEEMLSSVLLYRSALGMQSTPSVDVSDPGGLVKSQVMQTPDFNVSLTLNSTQATSTVSSQILNTYAGTGVNHIALSTKDIFAVARMLMDNNTSTMAVPENYYDDLASRFSIDKQILGDLKKYGILYDEDDNGSFYQLYTTMFANRFCIEIVQRNGYKGFGVPNAQIRMTMQSSELRNAGSGK